MTQSKHTPGPWFQHEGEVIAAEYGLISRAYYGHPDSQNVANARLIAESPTMHDLLLKLQAVRSPRELHNLRCEVAEVLARIEGV